MNYIQFQKRLKIFPVFSLMDIRKFFPEFSQIQLSRWQAKGYIRKIRQGYYSFTDQDWHQTTLFWAANKIYPHSYVSLEMALSYYGFIPEAVFTITSVNTHKTAQFNTPISNYSYRKISPKLFWGYKLLQFGIHKAMIAEPEKAILDYLYLNPRLKTADDFREMRINEDSFRKQVDLDKFQRYLEAFENKYLEKRAKVFLEMMKN